MWIFAITDLSCKRTTIIFLRITSCGLLWPVSYWSAYMICLQDCFIVPSFAFPTHDTQINEGDRATWRWAVFMTLPCSDMACVRPWCHYILHLLHERRGCMRVASPLVANITCAKGACVRAATTCCTCVKGCVRGATTRCTGDRYEGSARAWRRTCCTCLKGRVCDATTCCTGEGVFDLAL